MNPSLVLRTWALLAPSTADVWFSVDPFSAAELRLWVLREWFALLGQRRAPSPIGAVSAADLVDAYAVRDHNPLDMSLDDVLRVVKDACTAGSTQFQVSSGDLEGLFAQGFGAEFQCTFWTPLLCGDFALWIVELARAAGWVVQSLPNTGVPAVDLCFGDGQGYLIERPGTRTTAVDPFEQLPAYFDAVKQAGIPSDATVLFVVPLLHEDRLSTGDVEPTFVRLPEGRDGSTTGASYYVLVSDAPSEEAPASALCALPQLKCVAFTDWGTYYGDIGNALAAIVGEFLRLTTAPQDVHIDFTCCPSFFEIDTAYCLPIDATSRPISLPRAVRCLKMATWPYQGVCDLTPYPDLVEVSDMVCSGNVPQIRLPSLIARIGVNAFSFSTTLTVCDLSACMRLTEIHGFQECRNLSKFVFPQSLEKIWYNAFCRCAFTVVDLLQLPKLQHVYGFNHCPLLTHMVLPESVTAAHTMQDCPKRSVVDYSRCMDLQYATTWYDARAQVTVLLPPGISFTSRGCRAEWQPWDEDAELGEMDDPFDMFFE